MKRLRATLYACLPIANPRTRTVALEELHEAVATRGWRVTGEYVDVAGQGHEERQRLFAAARKGCMDVVLVPSLESFGTGNLASTLGELLLFEQLGIAFVSLAEPELSTAGDRREPVVGVLRALSEYDLHQRVLRVRAGMRRARRAGRDVGRPPIAAETRREIVRLRKVEGKSARATARALGVSRATVTKYQDRPVDDLLEVLPPRARRALVGAEPPTDRLTSRPTSRKDDEPR